MVSRFALVLFLALTGLPAHYANADTRTNNREFVIGFGLGVHTFSTLDDFRRDTTNQSLPLHDANAFSMYVEDYMWDRIGVGLRFHPLTVHKTTTACTFGTCSNTSRTVNVTNTIVTANWMPFISDDRHARLVIVGGPGIYNYNITQTGTTDFSGHVNGIEIMTGMYFEVSGSILGLRLGAEQLWTRAGRTNGFHVDASGHAYSIELCVSI